MHQKIAVIVWTTDPENQTRILLRHNKPFNRYEDEWTITFGNVELGENLEQTAIREVYEEFGITQENVLSVKNLNYQIKYDSPKYGMTQVNFFSIQITNIDVKIILNEESIGYDWMLAVDAKNIMKHEDEREALNFIH